MIAAKRLVVIMTLLLTACVSAPKTAADLKEAAQCAVETLTAWPGVKYVSTQFGGTLGSPIVTVTYEFPRLGSPKQQADMIIRRSVKTGAQFEARYDVRDDRGGTYMRARDAASLNVVCHITVVGPQAPVS